MAPIPHTLLKIVGWSPLFVRRQLAGVAGVESGGEKQAEFALSEKQAGRQNRDIWAAPQTLLT